MDDMELATVCKAARTAYQHLGGALLSEAVSIVEEEQVRRNEAREAAERLPHRLDVWPHQTLSIHYDGQVTPVRARTVLAVLLAIREAEAHNTKWTR